VSPERLKFAGFLTMFSAVATLPLVYLSYRLEGRIDLEAKIIETAIQLLGTGIFLFITLLLKKFLNELYRFHLTDSIIALLIKINVVIGVVSIASLYVNELRESLSVFVIIMIVVQGGVQTVFGYRLLKMPDSLNGMLKPFCLLNMATGIFFVSVIMIPLGILSSAVTDVMLGTMFLQAAKLLAQTRTTGPQD